MPSSGTRFSRCSSIGHATCLAKLTQFVDMAYKGVTAPGSLDDYGAGNR